MFFKKSIDTEEIALWIRENFKGILFLLSFLALSALAFIGWNKWKENREEQIQSSLYIFQKKLSKLVEDTEKGKDGKKENILSQPLEKKAPAFTPDMKSTALSYEKAIEQHHNSQSVVVFAIDLADFYYQRGDLEKAKKLLSPFVLPEKPLDIYHLASLQLAAYYMDSKECDKALVILSALVKNKKASSLHLEIKLQEAFCFEHLSQYDRALKNYEWIINQDLEGYIGKLAQDYKKMLLLKRNLKKKKLK